jgi:hypothetical protein
MAFKDRSVRELADMICGNFESTKSFFRYRSSSYLTEFFQDCDADYSHDGTTRWYWVAERLREILAGPQAQPHALPVTFSRVIQTLMDPNDATNEGPDRPGALALLNITLGREGYEAFYARDKQCSLRLIALPVSSGGGVDPALGSERERSLSRSRWLDANALQLKHADLGRRTARRGKTPTLPPAAKTLWQGMISATGFLAMA